MATMNKVRIGDCIIARWKTDLIPLLLSVAIYTMHGMIRV
uniref:Uncharacterized protein n=1 Tax=Arundo donax TaxID=35708 RepID=A0A0A9GEJ7_ARUDO